MASDLARAWKKQAKLQRRMLRNHYELDKRLHDAMRMAGITFMGRSVLDYGTTVERIMIKVPGDRPTIELLVDCGIRHGEITVARGAEILGITIEDMREIGRRLRTE